MADFKVALPNFTRVPADVYFAFEFERNFDHEAALGWFQHYWTSGFLFCAIYVLCIYLGQKYMQNRPRFELYLPLCLWSFSLAVFSLICTIRSWNEFIYIIRRYGWHASACDPSCFTSVTGMWAWLFTLSKLVELGDTAFIVLRKQKLIFLHWYHHITVLLYSWYSYGNCTAPGRYFVFMNVNVHTAMYTYYTAKAAKLFSIPRWVSMFITIFQTTQMFVGILVNLYALHVLNSGGECSTTYDNLRVSFLMYASYFALFIHFFVKAYFGKKSVPSATTAGKTVVKEDLNSNGHGHITNGVHRNGVDKKKEL